MSEVNLTILEIDSYRQKIARKEDTIEDAKRIVAYLREKRGHARPDPTAKKKTTKIETGITVDDLLEGL